MSQPFNLAETGLQPGLMLIEASAGTGKTYTLAGLVLRLIVEEAITIRQVLVVTFTEAAAGELRDRVRRRLVEAWQAFRSGQSNDELLQALLRKPGINHAVARRQLWQALLDFDEAPIHTIHAFCQRVLDEQAFETGQPYGVELVTDARPLFEAVARDWWRKHLYSARPLQALAALAAGFTVEELAKRMEEVLKRPGVRVENESTSESLEASSQNLTRAFLALREAWQNDRETIKAPFLDGNNDWANDPYAQPEIMDRVFERIDGFLEQRPAAQDILDLLVLLTPDALQNGTNARRRKNPYRPPQHMFFDRCLALARAFEDHGAWLWKAALDSTSREVDHLLAVRNARTYHAQLSQVAGVLCGPHGRRLASALAECYRAALIDEFQDTDPLQFEIFNKVFNCPSCRLWMVGDPKQAIYAFRGADVFTYLEARGKVPGDRVYSLPRNQRSDSRLVAAVNKLFGWQPSFVIPGIGYEEVQPCGSVDERRLREQGKESPPLRLWLWEGPTGNDSDDKNWDRLAPAVAREVRWLLDHEVTIGCSPKEGDGRRRLRASDMAVLVERHRDGDKVEAALREAGIATSRQSMASVFGTDEASELWLVLQAIATPADEAGVRAALATRLLGQDAAALDTMAEDEQTWRAWLERLSGHQIRWSRKGFSRMFQNLLQEEGIARRLLKLPDGARRLTNLMHLGGLLGAAADQDHLQLRGLLRWFTERRSDDEAAPEEHTLRIERDDDAVRILTAHASKGLQYPVVFCPYLQKPAKPPSRGRQFEQVLFHESDDQSQIILDLRRKAVPGNVLRARREKLAGAVRLLYVALTRAEHRCYLAWGKRSDQLSGAPAWLFLRPDNAATDPAEALHQAVEQASYAESQTIVRQLAQHSPDCIQVESLPEAQGQLEPAEAAAIELELRARSFTASLEQAWGISSFTSLSKAGHQAAADRSDPASQTDPLREPAADPLKDFGAGARLGECVHETLEIWMGSCRGEQTLEEVAARKMAKFGFGGTAQPANLAAVLQRALELELPGAEGERVKLSEVPSSSRLAEVKFHFPLRRVTPNALVGCFQGEVAPQVLDGLAGNLGSLKFSPREGYLTGSIDLVCCSGEKFYLVDWKTNRLPDYEPAGLRAAMLEHHYGLQYHLYALALDRFLSGRVPGFAYHEHFGGVFYLFLRGLGPARPRSGVFYDRPSKTLMERLRATLLAPREDAP